MALLAGVCGGRMGGRQGTNIMRLACFTMAIWLKSMGDALISPRFVWSCGVSGGVVLPFEGDGLAASEV